ncbi:hypothetical protein H9Q69_010566 [Fusarium xylarioides]|nr:hypothetical protein H9Q73_001989 [Fusarium xylarioides]KAG5790375.1 hypothetical protein H9Q69_010566 [Fusarium xylarioides]KAG5817091.1 hypothetical protein H9Q74_010718 [Fusarium xylarioides]
MHCNVFLLAVGFIADAAMASPCKPSGTTSAATSDVTRATESSVTTTLGDTTTTIASETSELLTTTGLSLTTTLEGSVTTTAASGTTTVTSEAETTSTAPAANPTYSLLANGGNLNNAQPQGNIEMTSVLVFNPALPQTGGIRTFNIEPSTGRLQDANGGTYVCAYYGSSPDTSSPPTIAYCNPSHTGTNKGYDYLKCEVVGEVFSCTAPQTFCQDDEDIGLSCLTPQDDVYDQFFTERRVTGMGTTDFWYIGSGSPSGLDPISITALKV